MAAGMTEAGGMARAGGEARAGGVPWAGFVAGADGRPVAADDLPARSRGVIGLLEENCTICMLCARECPDWCIYIESHKEPVDAAASTARPRVRNVLDRFAIDFSLCMYCGICVEACPYDALFWSPEYAYPAAGIAGLTHERELLREWMWTVPPPPALDPGAPSPGPHPDPGGPPPPRALESGGAPPG